MFNLVVAGTLISHEKLLLQINTEREMGNMDYKLGQVCDPEQKMEGNVKLRMLNKCISPPSSGFYPFSVAR